MAYQTRSVPAIARTKGMQIEQFGAGRPLLVLHGGGGLATVETFARGLGDAFEVILPTHPGFDGTDRPAGINGVKELAGGYADIIAEAGLREVIVIAFSMGGWIAAEMAASFPQDIAGLVLVDAVGLTVPGETVLDVFTTPPGDLPNFSFHRPDAFRIDPTALSPERQAMMRANFEALAAYDQGHAMQDPDLASRLGAVAMPALVVWGESDRVATPAYGRAFAEAIPGCRFETIAESGHLPQIEQPAALRSLLTSFVHELPPR
ncbi:alpha/beta fold hydrolase [Consotaella aegiceratis]|uniref:alpha/beta fold hydrolase n=1 Tax=Consotaella aegiceratis TaxID=3097961 RepID=UPI002F3EB24A